MTDPFFRLELVIGGAFFTLLVALYGAVIWFRGWRAGATGFKRFGIWLMVPGAAVFACMLYAHFVEPNLVEVTHQEIRTGRLPAGVHLRIVQLSDTHVRDWTRTLSKVEDAVKAARPDVVIFTGDAADSSEGLDRFRALLRELPAPMGRYAVRGNHDMDESPAALFGGIAVELDGAPISLLGGKIVLCGAAWGSVRSLETCLAGASGAFRIAVYHSPDLIEQLRPLGPDLYLAGHTHVGQVRLPFYGAVITYSRFGKRFDMGRYQVGATTLYVNRGIGTESGFPSLRFLCRPEVTVIDLVGTGGKVNGLHGSVSR